MSPKAKRPFEVTLQWAGDDHTHAVAEYPTRTYRFLLSDGRTVDVTCHQADNYVRAEVIRLVDLDAEADQRGEVKIEGVALVNG